MYTGSTVDGVAFQFTPGDAYTCASAGGFTSDSSDCVLADGQIRVNEHLMLIFVDRQTAIGSPSTSSINLLFWHNDHSNVQLVRVKMQNRTAFWIVPDSKPIYMGKHFDWQCFFGVNSVRTSFQWFQCSC